MFARWGRFVHHHRWPVLVGSALLLALSVAGIVFGGTLIGNGGFGASLPAGQAAKLEAGELHPKQGTASQGSEITLIFMMALSNRLPASTLKPASRTSGVS